MPDRERLAAELWAARRRCATRAARRRLADQYEPLVRYVATRTSPARATPADLAAAMAWGRLGLLDAIDRFDPHRPRGFEAFAMDQIRRAITEEARCVDRPMRPSDRDAALVARRGLRVVEAQPPGGQLAGGTMPPSSSARTSRATWTGSSRSQRPGAAM